MVTWHKSMKKFHFVCISGTLLAGIVALDAITLVPFVILQIQVSVIQFLTSKNYRIAFSIMKNM